MTYEQIANWINSNLDPNDYDTIEDFIQEISDLFNIDENSAKDFAEPFYEPEPEQFYEELQPSQQEKIEDIVQSPITKREQTVKVLETVKKEITIAEFVEATGMNPNTARRELGQGVKKGLFKRVGRGLYEEL